MPASHTFMYCTQKILQCDEAGAAHANTGIHDSQARQTTLALEHQHTQAAVKQVQQVLRVIRHVKAKALPHGYVPSRPKLLVQHLLDHLRSFLIAHGTRTTHRSTARATAHYHTNAHYRDRPVRYVDAAESKSLPPLLLAVPS